MSTETGSTGRGGDEATDLPSGRPVNENDHRTLGERLTGRGRVPEEHEPERARESDVSDERSRLSHDEGSHPVADARDAPERHRVEDSEAASGRRAFEDTQAVPEQERAREPRSDETQVVPGPDAREAGDTRDRELGHDDTRPLGTRSAADTGAGTRDEEDADGSRTGYAERPAIPDRRTVVARQKEDFGGVKIGAGFFGWLAATGLAVLLTALVAAVGAKVGVTDADLGKVTQQASDDLGSVGLAGGIALLVIIVVSYYAGGYVAGRMARFNGVRQGLVVWLWAIVIAAVVAGAASLWGSKYDILSTLNSFPRWPVDQGSLTTGGIIALIILALASLVGALLGGLAGMYFHRRVDKVGLPD